MSTNTDNVVDRVEDIIGKSTATAFVTPDSEDRNFILESLLTGAALFLIHRYFSGFFKPVEEAGIRHREMAIKILKDLSSGVFKERIENESRYAMQETVEQAKSLDSPERRATAENEIFLILQEYGESQTAAKEKASKITGVIFGD